LNPYVKAFNNKSSNLKMGLFIMVNGLRGRGSGEVNKYGRTDQFTRVIGKTIQQMALEG
jgi:hypothetical protein